ncbi:unnamed protein product [Amoebophrya sp. A25]|nr:unnamed protein product [Amoebophrya sp. A25]|eukprot:GSA25T00014944001.1
MLFRRSSFVWVCHLVALLPRAFADSFTADADFLDSNNTAGNETMSFIESMPFAGGGITAVPRLALPLSEVERTGTAPGDSQNAETDRTSNRPPLNSQGSLSTPPRHQGGALTERGTTPTSGQAASSTMGPLDRPLLKKGAGKNEPRVEAEILTALTENKMLCPLAKLRPVSQTETIEDFNKGCFPETETNDVTSSVTALPQTISESLSRKMGEIIAGGIASMRAGDFAVAISPEIDGQPQSNEQMEALAREDYCNNGLSTSRFFRLPFPESSHNDLEGLFSGKSATFQVDTTSAEAYAKVMRKSRKTSDKGPQQKYRMYLYGQVAECGTPPAIDKGNLEDVKKKEELPLYYVKAKVLISLVEAAAAQSGTTRAKTDQNGDTPPVASQQQTDYELTRVFYFAALPPIPESRRMKLFDSEGRGHLVWLIQYGVAFDFQNLLSKFYCDIRVPTPPSAGNDAFRGSPRQYVAAAPPSPDGSTRICGPKNVFHPDKTVKRKPAEPRPLPAAGKTSFASLRSTDLLVETGEQQGEEDVNEGSESGREEATAPMKGIGVVHEETSGRTAAQDQDAEDNADETAFSGLDGPDFETQMQASLLEQHGIYNQDADRAWHDISSAFAAVYQEAQLADFGTWIPIFVVVGTFALLLRRMQGNRGEAHL